MLNQNYLVGKQKVLSKIIIGVSIAIPVVVAILLFTAAPEVETSIDLKILPQFHAILNTLTAIALIAGFIFIKNRNIVAHYTVNLFALLFSVLFLVSYVVYHSLAESTPYGGEGIIRYVYYFILISHIILAAIIVPLVLFTFLRALTNEFEKHKKIARWTLPIWLYVAITGVIVYLMISPYYV